MTTQRKELTIFERGEIIGAWKCGISERKIAETLNHPKTTIHNVIFAYKNNNYEKPPPRSGRPPIMTERDNNHLTIIVKKNKKTTLQEIHEEFINSTSTNVCINTIQKFLHKQGFYGRVGIRKALVSETNRKKRLLWAKERRNWNDEWNNIIWSDESRFELFKGDGKKWVWRKPHEKYDIDCLIPTVKFNQGVMVWGCFTKNGLGPLVKLEGKITAQIYIDMLENNLLSYIDTLENKENYLFQEDNAPIHIAKSTKNWINKNNINILPWPAQSPDLNPIEHLWDELERKVRAHKPLPTNINELYEILQEEWIKIDIKKYQNLVNSMPSRINAVIDSKGYPTKY